MITYLIKAISCSGLLLLVYLLFLQREKMYRFNRFYLLFSIAFSFLAPLISITISTNTPLALVTENIPAITDDLIIIQSAQTTAIEEAVNPWPMILVALYATVATFLLCRFIINLVTLYRRIHKGSQVSHGNATLVLTDEVITPYSFLRYIFINKQDFDKGVIEKEILRHELTHVRQQHSLDILLMESLLVFCWVNPFLFLYRKSIQLNHEFLADESVINTFHDTPSYQYLLLNKLSGKSNALLTSSFNYLITKKRLTMMNKHTNRTVALAKQVALLPLLAGMAFLFSSKTYAQEPVKTKPPVTVKEDKKVQVWTSSKQQPTTLNQMPVRHIPLGPGATPEQLAEYDNVVSKAVSTSTTKDGKTITRIDMKGVDQKKISSIYKQMNGAQRATRDTVVGEMIIPFAPPAKRHPAEAQLQAWTDAAKYGIWVDEKRIENSELQKYQPADFDWYFESKLAKNTVNYGKHYYQVDLYSVAYYKKMVSQVSVTEVIHTSK
jgi:bla regulator protein BlaR1